MTSAIFQASNPAESAPFAFPHPFNTDRDGMAIWDKPKDEFSRLPRTALEFKMCFLSAALRSKDEWWRKYKDPTISARWQNEALQQGLNQKHIDYVFAELDGYASMRDESTGIEVSCYDGVWQSDRLIEDELLGALKAAVAPLELVSDEEKDWHPRSNGLVLDLVHPSLYPLVYGLSLRRSTLEPIVFSGDSVGASPNFISTSFAWLPTDFMLDESSASALSYINNIHPKHTHLVRAIESVVNRFVPLFERVLTDIMPANEIPLRLTGYYRFTTEGEPHYSEPDYARKIEDWRMNVRKIVLPDIPAYKGGIETRSSTFTLRGRTVQIIVKLANIILTPTQPEYAGGSWHVEGMANEHIVASGIYYYDEENITESRLAFRVAIEPVDAETYEQDEYESTKEVWGITKGEPLVQNVGSVQTKAGRCIAFPNVFQHCVSPFSLIDRTKPGHRKILALFLVDPNIRIDSTSDIAPQQRDLIVETLSSCSGPIERLPKELIQMIADAHPYTMTRSEAFEFREELMDERTSYTDKSNSEGGFFGTTFNMCEH